MKHYFEHTLVISCYLLGFFKVMRVLVEEKIPSSIERTINAPTPLAGSILELLKTPILHITQYNDPKFRYMYMSEIQSV